VELPQQLYQLLNAQEMLSVTRTLVYANLFPRLDLALLIINVETLLNQLLSYLEAVTFVIQEIVHIFQIFHLEYLAVPIVIALLEFVLVVFAVELL